MRDELVTIRKQLLVQPISLVDEAPANKLPVLLAKKPPMYPVPSPSPTQPSTTTLASSNYSESNNNSINTTVAALDDEEKKRLEKKIMKLKNLLGRERMQNAVKVFELEQHIKGT